VSDVLVAAASVGADTANRHVTVGLTVTLPCSASAVDDAQVGLKGRTSPLIGDMSPWWLYCGVRRRRRRRRRL